jgi:hypothetical protein
MPILVATISASSDAVFFSTGCIQILHFGPAERASRYLRNLVGVADDHQD